MLFVRHKIQRYRVHAVSLVGRRRTVVEDMAQMRAAAFATNFCAVHTMRVVVPVGDAVLSARFKKAGPPAGA